MRHSYVSKPGWMVDLVPPRPRRNGVGYGYLYHGHLSLGLPARCDRFRNWEGSLHPVNAYRAATALARLGPVGPLRPSFPWMR